MRTFQALVANTLVANVTNNFLWFALTFWAYLETRSVLATAIIGGGYMLLMAISGMSSGHRAGGDDPGAAIGSIPQVVEPVCRVARAGARTGSRGGARGRMIHACGLERTP